MHAAGFYAILLGGANLCRGDVAIIAPPRRCTMEAVRIEWAIPEWTGAPELIWVEIHELGTLKPVGRFDLFQSGQSDREPSSSFATLDSQPETLQRLHSVIQSDDYGPFDTPEVQKVSCASALYSSSHRHITLVLHAALRGASYLRR